MTARQIALLAARAADEKKARDILVYDLRGLSDVTDYFVIATAQSRLQSRAIIGDIERQLKDRGIMKLGQEGTAGGQWVLLDYTDVVIHIFSPELRDFYNIEALWGDAKAVNWK
jgi:ribosome-associated protein